MKDERKNVQEPYRPESTPTPPQVIDPSRHPGENDSSNEKQQGKNATPSNEKEQRKNEKGEAKEKLLGESPTEIDDETTI